MSPYAVAALVLVVVAGMGLLSVWRRRQANLAARRFGATAAGPASAPTGAYPATANPVTANPAAPVGNVGVPNPALPPPTSVDHRSRVQTSGPPVELQICGLPALAWQRAEWQLEHRQAMQLHLIVDTSVGLPFLQLYYRGPVMCALTSTPTATGIAELDARFSACGDLASWAPVLGQPQVLQALLSFPINTIDVYGGRVAFESLDGVHLDPGATWAIAQVAATLLQAVPRHITSAGAAPPATAVAGAHPGDPDGMVRSVLAGTQLSPQQQEAVMQMMRANQSRERGQ